MNRLVLATTVLAAMTIFAHARAENIATPDRDEAGIKSVIAQFQEALKAKSESGLAKLFTNPDAPVTGAASQAAFEFVRATKKADAPKVLDSTGGKFAGQMAKLKMTAEEKFSNVKIDSDGTVAAVSFDFTFLADGKPANLGKEAWLMVKTEQGWKISSIAYSINFPPKTQG
ncbi:protein of unknown function [Luteibacter sp. UNC138MFCol5.1]|uniref:DUF4440 domain-containing protein n=1 Tax=Luteibacter sp. UNC138MFCol5.1 TaxID=1502774 RepID=UPI0008D09C10|nr:DUF4440 domain-containing protein [Luteibacter sp. UNC138MFCol5.1]SEO67389.1 protein of unknown function [Luteibacter sp. UNC138MFCol5.1]